MKPLAIIAALLVAACQSAPKTLEAHGAGTMRESAAAMVGEARTIVLTARRAPVVARCHGTQCTICEPGSDCVVVENLTALLRSPWTEHRMPAPFGPSPQ